MGKLYERSQLLQVISACCLGILGIALVISFFQGKWWIVITADW